MWLPWLFWSIAVPLLGVIGVLFFLLWRSVPNSRPPRPRFGDPVPGSNGERHRKGANRL